MGVGVLHMGTVPEYICKGRDATEAKAFRLCKCISAATLHHGAAMLLPEPRCSTMKLRRLLLTRIYYKLILKHHTYNDLVRKHTKTPQINPGPTVFEGGKDWARPASARKSSQVRGHIYERWAAHVTLGELRSGLANDEYYHKGPTFPPCKSMKIINVLSFSFKVIITIKIPSLYHPRHMWHEIKSTSMNDMNASERYAMQRHMHPVYTRFCSRFHVIRGGLMRNIYPPGIISHHVTSLWLTDKASLFRLAYRSVAMHRCLRNIRQNSEMGYMCDGSIAHEVRTYSKTSERGTVVKPKGKGKVAVTSSFQGTKRRHSRNPPKKKQGTKSGAGENPTVPVPQKVSQLPHPYLVGAGYAEDRYENFDLSEGYIHEWDVNPVPLRYVHKFELTISDEDHPVVVIRGEYDPLQPSILCATLGVPDHPIKPLKVFILRPDYKAIRGILCGPDSKSKWAHYYGKYRRHKSMRMSNLCREARAEHFSLDLYHIYVESPNNVYSWLLLGDDARLPEDKDVNSADLMMADIEASEEVES
ncbi:hypothetical protein RND71_001884 [Anisodus tanguticus]|uniref:Uncharacterized protein n=1 Tax=Anisodus tanguticus TaxID=243964 RepID=A0AAE1T1N7_9SOLA|nr:hypothetical protein RND71_001884 [Anisodus tanguticus]